MAKISELPDELLVKILTFLPTKDAVSTSVLSKQWEYLWMWLPKLKFNFPTSRSKYACLRDFIAKNLPLHKAPVIESLRLCSYYSLLLRPEDLRSWVGIAVSRFVRELSIHLSCSKMQPFVSLPSSLYSCNLLVTLELGGQKILVDVPPTVCLPSLKTLKLRYVTYSNDESLRLLLSCCSVLEHLSIYREESEHYDNVLLPCSLYSLKSLVTLELQGQKIVVDVPPTVSLPSLKTLQLRCVTYSNEDSLPLLLSYCPVLEDLIIKYDNLRKLVIIVPSLQRLSLCITTDCSSDGCVIVTPSLKSFNVVDERSPIPYLIEHMPELEEADIILIGDTERLLKSITNVKRLSLSITFNSGKENVYPDGVVFSQLENLKLDIRSRNWSKLLVHLLKDSPNLRVLDLEVNGFQQIHGVYEPLSSRNNQGCIPTCFLNSLETFKFKWYNSEEQEDRDFLSFIFKHACCLKSTTVVHI